MLFNTLLCINEKPKILSFYISGWHFRLETWEQKWSFVKFFLFILNCVANNCMAIIKHWIDFQNVLRFSWAEYLVWTHLLHSICFMFFAWSLESHQFCELIHWFFFFDFSFNFFFNFLKAWFIVYWILSSRSYLSFPIIQIGHLHADFYVNSNFQIEFISVTNKNSRQKFVE